MSRMRILAKVRNNPDYIALARFLDSIGFRYVVHPPTGKGHPFLRISLPHGVDLDHYITCTPKGHINSDARVARLKRALASAGYRFGGH